MQTLTLKCDQCRKEANAKAEGRFWHHLVLRYANSDSIPASVRMHDFDLCSKDCLRGFVEVLKGA